MTDENGENNNNASEINVASWVVDFFNSPENFNGVSSLDAVEKDMQQVKQNFVQESDNLAVSIAEQLAAKLSQATTRIQNNEKGSV